MLETVLLLTGFLLLIKGADFFVEGSSALAKLLKVSATLIGLTIVAFGTSTPETAVSITAALRGSNSIAFSNIIGSNIFNLLMVIGVCALIKDMPIDKKILKKDYVFCVFLTLLLMLMIFFDKEAGRLDGIVLLLLFIIYIYIMIKTAQSNRAEIEEIRTISPLRAVLYIVGGVAAIILGGNLVVDNARIIALNFGLSETLVGLTIIAVGTSLPELVTSVVASRKGENGLALGNVVGSSIFNIAFILGFSATMSPLKADGFILYDMAALLITMLVTWLLAVNDKKVSRKEGILLVSMYIAYMVYIIKR